MTTNGFVGSFIVLLGKWLSLRFGITPRMEVQFLFSTSKAELARFLMLMKAFIRRLISPPHDKTDLIEEMYSIYLRNGFFYHSAYQISPAALATGGNGDLVLHRGISPDLKLFMSGLGFYSVQTSTSDRTISSMFGLQEQSFESYLEELLAHCEWEQIEWPDNSEFLVLDPPFKWGYWQQIPEKNDHISPCKIW